MKFLHSKNRLESVSDGVFAFAATLMVVNIGNSNDGIAFYNDIPNLVSFAVSFFVMMAIWKVHYNYFRRTDYIDNWVIAFNMVLLFMVLFYVFPIRTLLETALKGLRLDINEFSKIFQIYSAGFSALFLCFVLMYYRAYKKTATIMLLFYARHFLIFVSVGIISLLLAKFHIGLQFGFPGFVYATLGLFCYFHSKWFFKNYPEAIN